MERFSSVVQRLWSDEYKCISPHKLLVSSLFFVYGCKFMKHAICFCREFFDLELIILLTQRNMMLKSL